MPHTEGVGYSTFKDQKIGPLIDPVLSPVLLEAVQPLCNFVQWCSQKKSLGFGQGNEFEMAMAGDDPRLIFDKRTPPTTMTHLQEEQLEFKAHSLRTFEMGLSMKWNKEDVKLSIFSLIQHIRDVLARDTARIQDRYVAMECSFTPWRYIPYSDTNGARVGPRGYVFPPVDPGSGGFINNDSGACIGKIVPVGYAMYGGQSFNGGQSDVWEKSSVALTEFTWAADPLVFLRMMPSSDRYLPGPRAWEDASYPQGIRKDKLDLRVVDPAADVLDPNVYKAPELNFHHLVNMISFAKSIGVFPYEKDLPKKSYVLIASSTQILNLVNSFWAKGITNSNSLAPKSWDDLKGYPKINGAQFLIPGLGVDIICISDDYATLHGFDYLRTATGVTVPFTTPIWWGEDASSYMGQVIDVTNLGTSTSPTGDSRTLGAVLPKFRATGTAMEDHGYGIVKQHLPAGFSSCYLLGKEVVQELVNAEETIVSASPEDYDRLEGLAWKMRKGFKAITRPSGAGGVVKGMPFDSATFGAVVASKPVASSLSKSWLPYYRRFPCIKFDWPTWWYLKAAPGEDEMINGKRGSK